MVHALANDKSVPWGALYSVVMLDKGMIHTLGGTERDSGRLYHATQNNAQFKAYELFGIVYLIFSDFKRLTLVNWRETKESEAADDGGLLHCFSKLCKHDKHRQKFVYFYLSTNHSAFF